MKTNELQQFLDYIRHEKRLSPHTVVAYETDLGQFAEYLVLHYESLSPLEADGPVLRSWIVSLVAQGMHVVTVNRKMAALKAFYKFLRKKEIVTKDPARSLTSLKKPKQLPEFVDEQAMELLFEGGLFGEDPAGLRDRVVLEILYGTGIRLSELIGLKIKDLDLESCTIRVFGKRARERIVPFTRGLGVLLRQYLTGLGDTAPQDVLLRTDKGEALYPVYVQRLVKRYLSGVTSLRKKSPHVLRHTYATHLLNRGADLNAIKELLGHSSLAATQIYTHNGIEALKKSFLQAHPKA